MKRIQANSWVCHLSVYIRPRASSSVENGEELHAWRARDNYWITLRARAQEREREEVEKETIVSMEEDGARALASIARDGIKCLTSWFEPSIVKFFINISINI